MMTAEQLPNVQELAATIVQMVRDGNTTTSGIAYAIAGYGERCAQWAAAQLAEKERRYAFCEVHSGQENPVCPCCEAVYQADLRVEKEREIARLTNTNCCGDAHQKLEWAEKRLQEAQARAECDAADWSDTHTAAEIEIADLRERLRQREAELEQALALLRDLPLDRFGDDMGKHDAADFVDHAGYFFDVMFRAKKLLAPSPPKEGAHE